MKSNGEQLDGSFVMLTVGVHISLSKYTCIVVFCCCLFIYQYQYSTCLFIYLLLLVFIPYKHMILLLFEVLTCGERMALFI